MLPPLQNNYAQLPDCLFYRQDAATATHPRLIALNDELCCELRVSSEDLRTAEGTALLAGNGRWPGSEPRATVYAGHQFGGFSGQLGDGRALLLGELPSSTGQLFEIQLKGSGPTPYSRGGDGRAALGPVLREYLMSEAMHALGIPTTRALAAVATGDPVYRQELLPGALITRVATSHLRVGTFEFAAASKDGEALRSLVDFALERHPTQSEEATDNPDPRSSALRLLDDVIDRQAKLIARWMGVGFIHGVMNTDNASISGETIDYGPCAFMDAFDPARKFSSIDRGGRYAYQEQPKIAPWNMARLAEALLPLIDKDEPRAVSLATDLLEQFTQRYTGYYAQVCTDKLGLTCTPEETLSLMEQLLAQMAAAGADFTLTFRHLTTLATTDSSDDLRRLLPKTTETEELLAKLKQRHQTSKEDPADRLQRMKKANPLIIPRNHRVEEVLRAAHEGNEEPFHLLCSALTRPYDDQEEAKLQSIPPGEEQWSHKTFCGT